MHDPPHGPGHGPGHGHGHAPGDHGHPDDRGRDAGDPHGHDAGPAFGPGHNAAAARRPAQWQAPHLPPGAGAPPAAAAAEPDLDLVEAAFAEAFAAAPDPTSLLRLAGIPFEAARAGDGAALHLLRVEQEAVTDVGALTPRLGGGAFRYDPLPARLVGRRRRLRFVYADPGGGLVPLGFAEARALPAAPA